MPTFVIRFDSLVYDALPLCHKDSLHTPQLLKREARRAEAESNQGPSVYQPNALPLGQNGSPGVVDQTWRTNSIDITTTLTTCVWWVNGEGVCVCVCVEGGGGACGYYNSRSGFFQFSPVK